MNLLDQNVNELEFELSRIEMKQPILYIDSNFRLKRYEIVNRTKGKVKHQK